jgi:hypothetical protein
VQNIEFDWLVRDLPPTLRLQGGEVDFKLRWKDGSASTHRMRVSSLPNWELPREVVGLGPSIIETDTETRAYLHSRRGTPNDRLPWVVRIARGFGQEARRRDQSLVGEIWMNEQVAKRLEEERPACEGWLKADLAQPTVRARTRLPEAATQVGQGVRLRIVVDRPTMIAPALLMGKAPAGVEAAPVRENVVGLGVVVARPTYGSMPIMAVIQPATGFVSYPGLPRVTGPFGARGKGFSAAGVHFSPPKVRRGDRWELAPGSGQPFELVTYTLDDAGTLVRPWQSAELPWVQAK